MLALAGFRRRCAGLRDWARSSGRAMPKKVGLAGREGTTPVTSAGRVLSGKGTSSGPVGAGRDGSVTIAVHAKPGARLSAVTDVTTEAVSVAIAAPPSDGEANAELCRYLSKVLEVKKSEVLLDKGAKSREKVVKILVSMTPDEVLEKLKKEASS